jgi:D-alanine-D-alanine ligase
MSKDMTHFGKVAVLMGGTSAEREISLISGNTVFEALQAKGVDAHKIDVNSDIAIQLTNGDFDRAFIMLHGRGGEDGQIQGLLKSMNLPFTGSDISAAVLSMNKRLSKQIWQQQGLPTATYAVVTVDSDISQIIDSVGLPLIIKPVNEGSSIGMSKVTTEQGLADAIQNAAQYDSEMIAERWINGPEFTVAILAGEALPIIRLKTPNEFYDYEAKYKANSTEYLCPCGLSEQEEATCKALALEAFKGLGMYGWGRIDVMRDADGKFYLLEANSVPGMTDHSLVPMAAAHAGISFEQLVVTILEQTLEEGV